MDSACWLVSDRMCTSTITLVTLAGEWSLSPHRGTRHQVCIGLNGAGYSEAFGERAAGCQDIPDVVGFVPLYVHISLLYRSWMDELAQSCSMTDLTVGHDTPTD